MPWGSAIRRVGVCALAVSLCRLCENGLLVSRLPSRPCLLPWNIPGLVMCLCHEYSADGVLVWLTHYRLWQSRPCGRATPLRARLPPCEIMYKELNNTALSSNFSVLICSSKELDRFILVIMWTWEMKFSSHTEKVYKWKQSEPTVAHNKACSCYFGVR